MNSYASTPTINMGFSFCWVGEPHECIIMETDIPLLDRRLESHVAAIGRVCALCLVVAGSFIFLAFYFESPAALMGVALALGIMAAALRVGELLYAQYNVTRGFGATQSNGIERS